jgi:hypothetical protein
MAGRKYIRIALTPEDEQLFRAAKSLTEDRAGVTMSDSMYALSVIRSFIRQAGLKEARELASASQTLLEAMADPNLSDEKRIEAARFILAQAFGLVTR